MRNKITKEIRKIIKKINVKPEDVKRASREYKNLYKAQKTAPKPKGKRYIALVAKKEEMATKRREQKKLKLLNAMK